MNADILKPWLEKAAEAFPGHEVRIQISMSQQASQEQKVITEQASVAVDGFILGIGQTMDEALARAYGKFTDSDPVLYPR